MKKLTKTVRPRTMLLGERALAAVGGGENGVIHMQVIGGGLLPLDNGVLHMQVIGVEPLDNGVLHML